MGHIVNSDRAYRLLQQRLDRNVTGAPASPVFTRILQLLFTPAEADLARQIPTVFVSLEKLSAKLGINRLDLSSRMTELAQKGLVFDVEHGGQRYFSLAPVVIGFFEFTFMRTRDNLPMKEIAQLFEEYMMQDDRFARSVFAGQTQIGRTFVREEALPDGNFAEVLDWERVSHIASTATAAGVSLCTCRHKASHLGKVCDTPLENCLTFNEPAEAMIRSGLAKRITIEKAARILQECKEAGLAQIGDNVQRKVSYVCNCCGCCCEMIGMAKTYNLKNAIVTANWIMEVVPDKCKGCGKCVKACPMEAIEMAAPAAATGDKGQRRAAVDNSICLGCGVCYTACKFGGLAMKPRSKRVFTPESTFDRIVAMAIERGKLANLLFEEPEKMSHRALGRVISLLEKSPPFKAAMAVEPLKSAFLSTIVKGAKWKAGKLGDAF